MAGKTPLTIIKESLYSRLLDLPEKEGQVSNIGLDFDVAPLTLRELFYKYCSRYDKPPGVNSADDFKNLRLMLASAQRHRECQESYCYTVVQQVLEKGLPYVMFGSSKDARLLNQFAKEVSMEVSQNKFLEFRYHHDAPNVIFAYCNLLHNTADLLLKHYTRQHPDRTVLIYTRRHAYWAKDGNFGSSKLHEFNGSEVYSRQLANF